MNFFVFIALLFLGASCANSRSENDFYDGIVKDVVNKQSPQKTILEIDYNMTYSEMMEYLFFLGATNNNIVGGAGSISFIEETNGKSGEEKRQIYLSEYTGKDLFYRIQSDDDADLLFGEISVVDPTNIRYGILLIFKDKIEKIDKIAYPIYVKKYGQPNFISVDKKKYIWIDDSQLIEYVKDDDGVYIAYSDAVLFAKEFDKLSQSLEERKKDYSKDL